VAFVIENARHRIRVDRISFVFVRSCFLSASPAVGGEVDGGRFAVAAAGRCRKCAGVGSICQAGFAPQGRGSVIGTVRFARLRMEVHLRFEIRLQMEGDSRSGLGLVDFVIECES